MFRDSIRGGEKATSSAEGRLRAKGRLEARVDELILSYSLSGEKNCRRFAKRLRGEGNMLFTFLEEEGVDWNNNAAERALRSSVVIRGR
ncbi:MAG: transposase [Thaumarchaeota archaeon]|nr:transposase [Nitrososphaerota archaeon]